MSSELYMFRALTAGWMMLIFILSSQTTLPTPMLFSGADLLTHAAFYAVLGVFLARSLDPPRVVTWKRAMLLTLLVAAYGMTDEYHQSFVPGRDASGWDLLADGLGGFLAALALFWWDRSAVNGLATRGSGRSKTHSVRRGISRPGRQGQGVDPWIT